MKSFSLTKGSFFDLHRSNLRPEIRVTTSIIHSPLKTSLSFPELRWIVGLPGISIIFTRDRNLALRIALYLKLVSPAYASTIRKCDATNESDYDDETFKRVFEDCSTSSTGLVLVATTILTLGIDIPNIQRVCIIDPIKLDDEVQQKGRLLRKKVAGAIAEAYVYVSPTTMVRAAEMVADDKAGVLRKKDSETKEETKGLSLSMAYRLVAPCQSIEQDRQYDNPVLDPPCFCESCSTFIVPDEPPPCLCSGCQPGKCDRDWIIEHRTRIGQAGKKAAEQAITKIPYLQGILAVSLVPRRGIVEKPMRDYLIERLHILRITMFDHPAELYTRGGFYTPEDLIPDAVIVIILDNFFALTTAHVLHEYTKAYQLMWDWVDCIFTDIRDSIPHLLSIHMETAQAEKVKRQAASDKAKEKRRDERALKTGIRKHLPIPDKPDGFRGQRWRWTFPNG